MAAAISNYRSFSPAHQARYQHEQPSWTDHDRISFDQSQRTAHDMAHINTHKGWIAHDLSASTPISQWNPEEQYSIILNQRQGDEWSNRGPATLVVNQSTHSSTHHWCTVYANGSNRSLASFSLFAGMKAVAFLNSVVTSTIQYNSSTGVPEIISYSFQMEDASLARRLQSRLLRTSVALLQQDERGRFNSRFQREMEDAVEAQLDAWVRTQSAAQAPLAHGPGLRSRRGAVDLGGAYWDLEKAKALREAKSELDALRLGRTLSSLQV